MGAAVRQFFSRACVTALAEVLLQWLLPLTSVDLEEWANDRPYFSGSKSGTCRSNCKRKEGT